MQMTINAKVGCTVNTYKSIGNEFLMVLFLMQIQGGVTEGLT